MAQENLKEDDEFEEENFHKMEVFCCDEEMECVNYEEYDYGMNEYYIELECKSCGMKATLIVEPKEEEDFDWTRPEFYQEELEGVKK